MYDTLGSVFNTLFGVNTAKAATTETILAEDGSQVRVTNYNLLERMMGKPYVSFERISNGNLPIEKHPILKDKRIAHAVPQIIEATMGTKIKPEWVAAMIFNESSATTNPKFKSIDKNSVGGITQIKSDTWKDPRYQDEFERVYGRKPSRNSLNDQIIMGTIILSQLYDEFDGNLEYMFRAYNSGSKSLREQLGIEKWTRDRTEAIKNSTKYWDKIKELLNIK
jgi:hypothetical protein